MPSLDGATPAVVSSGGCLGASKLTGFGSLFLSVVLSLC